jgi:hypothetical protein
VLAKAHDAMATDKYSISVRVLQFKKLGNDIKISRTEQCLGAFEEDVAVNDWLLVVPAAVNIVAFADIYP